MRLLKFAFCLSLVNCAHSNPEYRKPANIETTVSEAQVQQAQELFQGYEVSDAIVFGEPEASGKRKAKCIARTSTREELAPRLFTVATKPSDTNWYLPDCSPDVLEQVAELAKQTTQTHYAGGTITKVASCAVNFAVTGLVTGFLANVNDSERSKLKVRAPEMYILAPIGAGVATAASYGVLDSIVRQIRSGRRAPLQNTNMIILCGAAGLATGLFVGYWLKPAPTPAPAH